MMPSFRKNAFGDEVFDFSNDGEIKLNKVELNEISFTSIKSIPKEGDLV